jgi:regulator of protease activity HflC (stomatin/prohibitin superfamily)
MNYYITPAVVEQWRDVISTHTIDELWPSTALYSDLVSEVNSNMQAAVDKRTEGDTAFYNRLTFNLASIEAEQSYQDQYKQRQQAQTAAETAKLNKDAQVAQAKADQAVRVAQAKAAAAEKHADIAAFKLGNMSWAQAVRAYNEYQAIQAGINPYQPGGQPLITAGGN